MFEATRRRLTPRQAEVVRQLVDATEEEANEVGYAGLTVRSVARRAGVAAATAYTYFGSKDHLLAEVLWRRMQALAPVEGPPADGSPPRPVHDRVVDTVRAMVLFTTESPGLVDSCTVALLSDSPDVKHLRDRIGAQIHRRLSEALGPDADPRVVGVLDSTFAGALLTAGMGHMSSMDIPEFVAGAADLMIRGAGEPSP
jgi:AcrR family transcriptional regulator